MIVLGILDDYIHRDKKGKKIIVECYPICIRITKIMMYVSIFVMESRTPLEEITNENDYPNTLNLYSSNKNLN